MLIAYLDGLAGELREGLAQMGFHSLDEAIGRAELLRQVRSPDRPRANLLDLSPLLSPAPESAPRRRLWERNQRPPEGLEDRLIRHAEAAIESQQPVRLHYRTDNSERSTGARLAGAIARRYGEVGLPPATVEIGFVGSAGQSFGAFCVKGMKLHLEGQANDYVAKGMNGGEVIIVPPRAAARDAAKNVILGNTVLYGATGGLLFARGSAGERFCVRNSGASCVVEGVGDHGCEYMTGGVAVILGRIGRNFGAGMTGGVAFVLDERDHLRGRINEHTLAVSRVENTEDAEALRALIEQHQRCTGSERARRILSAWSDLLPRFWKLYARPGDQGAQEREDLEPSVPLVEDDDV
jgi:glutamate synthase domain-containing protein 3